MKAHEAAHQLQRTVDSASELSGNTVKGVVWCFFSGCIDTSVADVSPKKPFRKQAVTDGTKKDLYRYWFLGFGGLIQWPNLQP